MLAMLIRTVVLYIFLILAVRIMGKRQIGQMQPMDLVITIMISEIITNPIEDPDLPLFYSMVAVILLVAFEIVISVISMKNKFMRSKLQGNSTVIIRNGALDQKKIKNLRYNLDEVMLGLRQKDVFDLQDVLYAIVENDGSISVMLKPEKMPATVSDMKLTPENRTFPSIVITDGKVIKSNFKECGMTSNALDKILDKKKLYLKNVILMTADSAGNVNIIEKEDDLK
ncbi:MAG: DUF421 domain-containing protein [Oscillospiraceae bacterium]|nr:DUF421 domain-containing protein [Oscillospiraceae bacterium]